MAIFTATLVARHSDKLASVLAESTANGAEVVQWDYVQGKKNQIWNLEATTGGYYLVRATHSNKCLSVLAEDTADGAQVVQWDYVQGKQNQEWKLIQRDDYYYFSLEARHSGKLLSVLAAGTANGDKLVQWADENKPNQHFRLG
ncbi:RICIN domain-containing protein [Streptomyces sp. NBC_00354]|uniref:RICIN domain-containing protein n=1 Tax=Streptomyces sp. NBC_00354 TaxID=2975723 RepID=UPI002E264E34